MRTRAYYRHQHRRAWQRAYRIVTKCWHMEGESAVEVTRGMVRNRRKCSCMCCSQSKRWLSGPSRQERRQPMTDEGAV